MLRGLPAGLPAGLAAAAAGRCRQRHAAIVFVSPGVIGGVARDRRAIKRIQNDFRALGQRCGNFYFSVIVTQPDVIAAAISCIVIYYRVPADFERRSIARRALQIHTAARVVGSSRHRIVGNLAAGHGENRGIDVVAAAFYIHTAAAGSRIPADGTVGHVELCILGHIHTATGAGFIRASCISAADGATSHIERRARIHIHAAALTAGVYSIFGCIPGDSAAVHVKRAVYTHTAATATIAITRFLCIPADTAAVHIECAMVYINTFTVTLGMCDFPLLSCRLTISYGKVYTRHYMNRLTVLTRNIVSIQADNNILILRREIPAVLCPYIACQIVVIGLILCSTRNSVAVGLPCYIFCIAFTLMRSIFCCAQTVLMLPLRIRGGDKSGRHVCRRDGDCPWGQYCGRQQQRHQRAHDPFLHSFDLLKPLRAGRPRPRGSCCVRRAHRPRTDL